MGTGTNREETGKKKEGLWKLAPLMEIRKERGFPQRLEKSLANDARLFHSSHRPDGGDQLRLTSGVGPNETIKRGQIKLTEPPSTFIGFLPFYWAVSPRAPSGVIKQRNETNADRAK